MKNLIIEPTIGTPKVEFDVKTGFLKIAGICTPENPKQFFEPVMDKLNDFQATGKALTIEIFLEYFNSGSSKALLNLFMETAKTSNETNIHWLSEDEELKDAGIILEEISGLKFKYFDV